MNKCSYNHLCGPLKGDVCEKVINCDEDFCDVHKFFIDSFADICLTSNLSLISKHINAPLTQINDALFHQGMEINIIDFIINRSLFFPCEMRYEFMLNCKMPHQIHNIIDVMIYKRFLITQYLAPSLPKELIMHVLDPKPMKIDKPRNYVQFMVRYWLYKNDDMCMATYPLVKSTGPEMYSFKYLEFDYLIKSHNKKSYVICKRSAIGIADVTPSEGNACIRFLESMSGIISSACTSNYHQITHMYRHDLNLGRYDY